MLANSSTGNDSRDNERVEGSMIDGMEIYDSSYAFEGDDYVPGGVGSGEDSGTIISVLPSTSLSAEFMASLSTALSMALSLSFMNAKSFPKSSFSLLVLLATCAGVYYEKSHSPQLSQAQPDLGQGEAELHHRGRGQGVLLRTLNGLKESLKTFWEWRGSIVFHSIILLLHVTLTTHSLNECGVVRTLIVSECGPAATAIIVYCFNILPSSNIFSISAATTHPTSPQNVNIESGAGSGSSSSKGGDSVNSGGGNSSSSGGNSRSRKIFTAGSFSLVALGFVALIFSDTRSISGNVALFVFNIINYTRVFFLPNIPPQAYLYPTLISGLILAPWGVPSLLTRKFILLFDIKLLIVLFASFFSVNKYNIYILYCHLY